jgi:YD repeat-containing protein
MTPARLAPSLPVTALAGRDSHPQDIAGFAQLTSSRNGDRRSRQFGWTDQGQHITQTVERESPIIEGILGRHLWGRGYFAASCGKITDEVIMQYIAIQDLEGGPTMATLQ